MASKESSKEHLDDARQTLDSLRQMIVSQRQKWQEGMKTRTSLTTIAKAELDIYADEVRAELDTYIAKLYKESEVLEHMINRPYWLILINRIENDLEKVSALLHPGPGNWPDVACSISRVDLDEEVIATRAKIDTAIQEYRASQDWESHQENKMYD